MIWDFLLPYFLVLTLITANKTEEKDVRSFFDIAVTELNWTGIQGRGLYRVMICTRSRGLYWVAWSAWGSVACTRLRGLYRLAQYVRGHIFCMGSSVRCRVVCTRLCSLLVMVWTEFSSWIVSAMSVLSYWVVGCWVVTCLGWGADLHMAQLLPLPLTVSCSNKSRLVLPFWYWLTRVGPDKRLLNRCCCCSLLLCRPPVSLKCSIVLHCKIIKLTTVTNLLTYVVGRWHWTTTTSKVRLHQSQLTLTIS